MQTKHLGILRSINRKDKKYNILKAPTHESYESNWVTMPHSFYMYQKPEFVKWKTHQRPIPQNHVLLDGSDVQIRTDMVFDAVLAQNIFGQIQHLGPLANHMNIPLIRLEHTIPTGWTDKYIEKLKTLKADINVFISEYSVKAWKFSLDDPSVRVIHHGVDVDLFKPDEKAAKSGRITTVCNDYIGRSFICGYDIHQKITIGLPTSPIGDTKGFSEPSKSIEDLVSKLQQSSVFLNTSRLSPIPTSLLEAMAVGLPVVTTATCAIPEIVKDGYNGFISNDEGYLRQKLIWCLEHPLEAEEMGRNARKTIVEKFSLEKHIESWMKVFDEVIK